MTTNAMTTSTAQPHTHTGETTLNKNADCYLHEIWERFVGSLTPKEFMETEQHRSFDDAVDKYIDSMEHDFPEIIHHRNDLKRYLGNHYVNGGHLPPSTHTNTQERSIYDN